MLDFNHNGKVGSRDEEDLNSLKSEDQVSKRCVTISQRGSILCHLRWSSGKAMDRKMESLESLTRKRFVGSKASLHGDNR